ncbi:unnamed protein product [Diamesa serratosioi]
MQGLVARLKASKNTALKSPQRSMSIVSSELDDENNEDLQSNSDESQPSNANLTPNNYSSTQQTNPSDDTMNNSDNDTVTTSSSRNSVFSATNRNSMDDEWQMNYIINKRDGLPKFKREKKEPAKSLWNTKSKLTDEIGGPKKLSSRIDTNMVKLKLLDATRKAIIDKTKMQKAHNATQTDSVKTTLCKDQSIDKQNDLILVTDAQTEIDVEMTTKTKDGILIVSSSISCNTDKLQMEDECTQTAMPRSSVSFRKFLDSKQTIQYDDEIEDGDDMKDDIMDIEKRLKSKKITAMHSINHRSNVNIMNDNPRKEVTRQRDATPTPPKIDNDSDSELEDSIQDDPIKKHQPDIISESMKHKSSRHGTDGGSTFDSWHNIDFPEHEERPVLPRTHYTDGPTPWSNFHDMILGQRFLNTRLSPVAQRHHRPNLKQVTWSDSQLKVVSDLVEEANLLMEMFDQVAMLLGPDIKLHNISEVEDFVMPPSKYNKELSLSCDKIEESLRKLNGVQRAEKISINE